MAVLWKMLSCDGHHGWDKVIHSFLVRIGFHQAATGFTADLLVSNSDWEKSVVPEALSELTQKISVCVSNKVRRHHCNCIQALAVRESISSQMDEPSLEQRKLGYIHLANNMPPRSQSTVRSYVLRYTFNLRALDKQGNIAFSCPKSRA